MLQQLRGEFAFRGPAAIAESVAHVVIGAIAWLVLGSASLAAARRIDRIVPMVLLMVSIVLSSLPWQEFVAGGLTGRYAAAGWLAWANIAALAGIAWTCCDLRRREREPLA